MARRKRTWYTAARVSEAPAPDRVVVKIHPDQDAAQWEYGMLRYSGADKVRWGVVPAGIARQPDAAAVLAATLKDEGW